jgi:hypothetical protein
LEKPAHRHGFEHLTVIGVILFLNFGQTQATPPLNQKVIAPPDKKNIDSANQIVNSNANKNVESNKNG